MILSAHILIGATIGSRFKNYFLVFLLSFASHFALDSIPHWEYQVSTQKDIKLNKKKLRKELRQIKKTGTKLTNFYKILIDLVFGLIFAFCSIYFITGQISNIPLIIIGIFGALLPDAFTLLYFNADFQICETFTIFHFWIHSSRLLHFFDGLLINILLYLSFILILVI